MPTTIPIMPIILAVLLLLPIRLGNQALKGLAFTLWLIGGLVLSTRGVNFLMDSPAITNMPLMAGLIVAALIIGFGKGKFVLAKTSAKNIERIDQFSEPKKPIEVYSVRSWIIITLMVGISLALNIFNVDHIVRGPINLGIGFALIVSSLVYLKALSANKQAPASN
ncbi:hypothetical protein [Vampirovibrio sp.]|uniref:hypothetical protein n=1 Tax=Vampirovibrio sp. TaxID=2717857 RepID=UPI0035942A2A